MIEVKNVTKKYGDFYAVKDISFTVNDGEIVGFLGRNGAGKTTTMNMITGSIMPTEGEILINGIDVNIKSKEAKKNLGYMPEGTPLYADLTVKEFLNYIAELKLIPKKERKTQIEKVIKETGLEKVQKNLTKNLSRGYKQRVSFAGAIIGNPKILILDEPTVGLDPKQVIEIRELIKSFRKNHTVILSSHILSEVSQICEKVIIIDKGEIIAVDSPENLEKKTTEIKKLSIIVDSMTNNIDELKNEIKSIKNINLISENKEEKQYEIEFESNDNEDIRKMIFSACSKLNIVILEMKKEEASLESAFIKLVENRVEYSQTEIRKMKAEEELEDLRKEDALKKEERARRKQEKLEKKNKENKEDNK